VTVQIILDSHPAHSTGVPLTVMEKYHRKWNVDRSLH